MPYADDNEFLAGTEYELDTLVDLMQALQRNFPNTLIVNHHDSKVPFVPSISINKNGVAGWKQKHPELESYFDSIGTPKSGEVVISVFRVGGNTQDMAQKKANIEKEERESAAPNYVALRELKSQLGVMEINRQQLIAAAGDKDVGADDKAALNENVREQRVAQEQKIAEIKAYRLEKNLPEVPAPRQGQGHYVAATLHKKPDGTSSLIITDPLGSVGRVSGSYEPEIELIAEEFKKRFGQDLEVATNPPGTVFQGDSNSCGAACLYNLEKQLSKKAPAGTVESIGLEDNRLEMGAGRLRLHQKELYDEEKALQEAISASLDPRHQISEEVSRAQAHILQGIDSKLSHSGPVKPGHTPQLTGLGARGRSGR